MKVLGLDHIVLTVADVERSLQWYTELVGLKGVRVEQWRRGDAPFPSVRVNEFTIIDLLHDSASGCNMDHFCLVVTRADIDEIVADDRFPVLAGPGGRYGAQGTGWSVYVRDPDGNTVEFRAYETD